MPLNTVGQYVAQARVLLQDEGAVKRYTDGQLKDAIGLGLLEARRLRPDMFIGRSNAVPDITSASNDGTTLDFDQQYRLGLVYWVTGYMMLREDESGETAKAAQYITTFKQQLVSLG